MIEPRSLRAAVSRVSRRALASGALQPLATTSEIVEDSGIRFVVRVLPHLERKPRTAAPASGPPPRSPFLPPEPDLLVGDLTPTHLAVLNKFNAIEDHLLVVPRRFEEQDGPLGREDFEAAEVCLAAYPALVFYNGGTVAGASQRHKHMQVVPLPLDPEGRGVPIEPLLVESEKDAVVTAPGLGFAHAFARRGAAHRDRTVQARRTLALYERMRASTGLGDGEPYNLLVTRGWMLLVPRARECIDSVSVNSLGYAGCLLVHDARQLRRIRDLGPLEALRRLAR